MKKAGKRTVGGGMGIGSASIVMIFVVLCLTAFGVLTFSLARSQLSLTKKSAQAATAYYGADGEATRLLGQLDAVLANSGAQEAVSAIQGLSGVTEVAAGDGAFTVKASFTVEGEQSLQVEVRLLFDGSYQVTRWQVVNPDLEDAYDKQGELWH